MYSPPSNLKSRCDWVTNDDIYIRYHDKEWGVPVFDDLKLFEMLILEGSQAGLSWLTILKRRDNYKKAYDNFDSHKISNWTDHKIQSLLNDPSIIRNKLKVNAAKKNAQAYIQVVNDYGTFRDYIWSFVNNKPIINQWKTQSELPVKSIESKNMSKSLKYRGFKFVGPTICYAFMQAVGMINDHVVTCHRYNEINSIIAQT